MKAGYRPLIASSVLGMMFAACFCFAQEERSSQDASFTPAQLQRMLERFPNADQDGNGRLTPSEARVFLEQRRSENSQQNIASQQRISPTFADVSYGPHQRQVFDFYQASSDSPTPLIVYIHGGGFVGGDKQSIQQDMLRSALDSGISMAALHYRFVDGEQITFPVPQRDCARALQLLRSKADEWNIDPERVACYGGSAGAGISMWLGFHDDLAAPTSSDPIARQSTRVVAVGTMGGQGTYDPIKIKELVGGRAWEHPSLVKVYGLEHPRQALMPSREMQRLYDEASAITHLTEGDPPLFMIYSEPDIVPPEDSRPGQFIHHPNFGKQLKSKMDELKIENIYVHTDDAAGRDLRQEMLAFFERHFEK